MNAVAPIADEPEAFERVPPEGVEWHPYSNLFPWMDDDAFEELKADVAKNGVLEPVVFIGKQILDGRNRYMAARALGIEYPRVEYRGDDPLGYVVSLNLKRRHLSEGQRADAAAKIANQKAGDNQHSGGGANLPDLLGEAPRPNITIREAAKMLNVSERSVKAARKVREDGSPSLVAAVEKGHAAVSAAAEVAKLPVEEQQSVVEAGPLAIKEVAKVVRETGADPETAALREAVIEAARQGLAPERKDRRNRLYEHDPVFRMLMRIVGPCRAMIEQVDRGEIVIAEALSGFLDDVPGQRERDLTDVARARDFLTQFLEASHAD
jgi:hypothetical protein